MLQKLSIERMRAIKACSEDKTATFILNLDNKWRRVIRFTSRNLFSGTYRPPSPHPTPPPLIEPINCEAGWAPESNRKISKRENSLTLAMNSIFIQVRTIKQI